MMSKSSRGVKRRLDDGSESLEEMPEERPEERPAQVARVASTASSESPLVPRSMSVSSSSNHIMEEISTMVRKIKEGKDETGTTVTQYLGLCLRASARKARPHIFHQLLLMDGLDVNDVDEKGRTTMMYACQSGCEELVRIMLESTKFNPELRDTNGNGLLYFAVKNKHLKIVELLLADSRVRGSLNTRNTSGTSPLILACTDGTIQIAQKLLSFPSIDVNVADDNGDSPLLHAVMRGFEELVFKLLKDKKIMINKPNENGDTPLMCAVNEGFVNIVEKLLEFKDIDVNSSNVHRNTSLMCAADKGYEKIVKLLLAHPDIDINLKDSDEDSALIWAVDKNHGHVVDLLVERRELEVSQKHLNAITSHLTQSGLNNLADVGQAVMTALENRRPKVGLWLLKEKIKDLEKDGVHKDILGKILVTAVRRGAVAVVELLVKNSSVNVNILDQNEPLLIIAADMKPSPSAAGYVDIVRSLISRSCDVNVKGSSGNTALIRACDRGNSAMVTVLLSHSKIDVNIAGEDGKSALIRAGELGHQDIVKQLVKYPGVEINMKDEDGYTGLIWAADNGHLEAVTEFMKHPEIDVNAVDLDGISALTWAADRGHTPIVSLLLDQSNLDVNVRNFEGLTPLICAATQGNRKVVKLLLADDRTDVNLQDNDDYTALLSAVKGCQKNRDPTKKEDFEEVIRCLVKHPKVDLNKKKSGKTAFEMVKSSDKSLYKIFTD